MKERTETQNVEQAKESGSLQSDVDALVMPDQKDILVNTLAEHIQVNAECLERLAIIVSAALPHTAEAISGLLAEWQQINKTVNNELRAALLHGKEA